MTLGGTSTGLPFGRYTLLRPIGRGGMAEVWKAKIHGAQNFQRLVVVKRILPHLSSDPEFVRMFTVEAMLSARLNHPNIVQVFEFAEVAGERYLAMEYVHGINLGDLQKRLKGVPVPVAMAAHLVREISLALGYAHALPDDDGKPLSLIHRDVSPSNVMIGYDGGVKLLDFGVAKALSSTDELTRTGALKGKVAYMSPEAVDGELTLDGRTDIFAAGVVLYELLTGKRLFKGGDDLRTIALVRACKVDPPSKERPDIPAELDRIALKALARDRDQRYERADDLAADLNQVAHDLQWDATRTSLFLKQHDIQPGSEPELKPAPAGTGPSEASPATMQVTVLERRAGRSSTSLPAVGRPRLRWALLGAGGALLMASALAMATRWWADGAVAAPFSMPSLGSSRAAEPSRAQPVSPEPPSSAAATTPEPEIVPVPPASSPSSETATALAPVDTAESSRVANAEKSPARAKRRKRVSRPTPPPPEEPAKPQVDLKRGDVIRVF
jgi:serine/threonine protein kinase